MTKKALRFSAAKKSVNIEMEQEDGTIRVLQLKEMSAAESDSYAAYLQAKLNGEERKGIKANFISRCLFDPSTNKFVPIEEILGFSSTMQNLLEAECNELNGYTIDSLDAAKKRSDDEKKN
jgi:hypothetical protein